MLVYQRLAELSFMHLPDGYAGLSQKKGIVPGILGTLAGLARFFSRTDQLERAAELAALVSDHPAAWHEQRERVASVLAQLETRLPPAVMAAARQRGRAGDLAAMADRLLAEEMVAGAFILRAF